MAGNRRDDAVYGSLKVDCCWDGQFQQQSLSSRQLGRDQLGEFIDAPPSIRMQGLVALAASDANGDNEDTFSDVDLVHYVDAGLVAKPVEWSVGPSALLCDIKVFSSRLQA
jgi:hypothetical protein